MAEQKKKTAAKTTPKKTTTKKTTTKKSTTTTKKKPTTTRTKKTKEQLKKEVITEQAVKEVFEGQGKKPKGKTFYLFFSLIVFGLAFFYINNVVYDNQSYLESALFALTALFVILMLLNFNVHRIIFNFFVLPFKYLIKEAQLEAHKEVIEDDTKKGVNKKFGKYKALFTISLYSIILLLLVGSQIYNGILDGDKVLVIITQSLLTGLVFLIIVCSWQYLFNIIPNILENSIDAKNGYILTLSAIVMIVYVIFLIFDITYLSELMIFILIVGFISLLGVNVNMIVGEFNIFQNLRNRRKQNKTVTRAVFLIFFSFHLYIILYASVVAYSIYNWNPESYNFTNYEYKQVLVEDVSRFGTLVTDVYDVSGNLIDTVYDEDGNEITDWTDSDGNYITTYYDSNGLEIIEFYMSPTDMNPINEVSKDNTFYYQYGTMNNAPHFVFHEGTLKGIDLEVQPHTYGDMLYYAVITISSIGYGDISPNSNVNIAQIWGGFLSIYGITFYALSIGYVSNIAGLGVTQQREDE